MKPKDLKELDNENFYKWLKKIIKVQILSIVFGVIAIPALNDELKC